ncbi:ATP-binding protein [Thalassobaculum sp. OXR-137]|uniref:HAMP domain-containing sensor histidine kinase n=1 Tax=Thalassobaculum sp. OXR-137 TaxID=3100173 RepID=UPI002AC983B8|nr:ATP-binding protein [Thalassobaculum sp. OXR-137]WPZ35715.1 ATP-binding protein [Thalassobaculum sp. OXR-137]
MAFLAVTLPLVIVVVGGFFVLLEREVYNEAVERLESKLDRMLASNTVMLARAVWERNDVLIATHAAPALIDPDLIGIFIYDRDGHVLAEFGTHSTPQGKSITRDAPISYAVGSDLQYAGQLVLVMTDAGIRASARSRILMLVAFAVLLTAAVVFAAQAAFDFVIGRPLRELQKAIDSTRLGAPREEVPWSGTDEVAQVIEAFNRMQRRHTAYETALDEARIDLEHRVEERTAELKRARDEARAANRAKSAFLANMSHELRTPLNAIIGFAEVLKNQKFGPLGDERYSSYAEIVRTSGTHLLDLINDLLDLSRAEAGGLIPADSTIAADAQIRRAIDMSRPEIDASGLTIEVAVPDEVPPLRADARLILQLLSNLITNAVKFTREGGTITIGASIDQRRSVSLYVQDTGIGIPQDQIDKVLEPFTQLDTRLHREHRGAGLGLPLCRAIAQAHGGQLVIDSEFGVGTRITVSLPPWRALPPNDTAAAGV